MPQTNPPPTPAAPKTRNTPHHGDEPARRDGDNGAPTDDQNSPIDYESHDHDEIDLNVSEPRRGWLIAAAVVGFILLAALFVTGFIPRHHQNKELAADSKAAAEAAVPVLTVTPRRSPQVVDISIPGTLRPWQEVSIYARTSGYLKKFYVDISNQVEAGELMAEIDTPDLDQELQQAQATLLQVQASVAKAIADRDLAKATYDRAKTLLDQKFVSQQEADEKIAAVNSAESSLKSVEANVKVADASVRRLEELQRFKQVKAPFGGVVTGRSYDVGSLIIANPTSADIKPMYKIAENDVLRAFVNVPQSAALQIRKKMPVRIKVRERPGREFMGVVMGTTNYLDPNSRSLLTEVRVENVKEPSGEFALLPGMYVTANFNVHRDAPPLVIPGPALVNNANGTLVGVVKDGIVHFQKVTLGQDYGSEVEVVEGLNGDEQIIANPGERVVEGVKVAATQEKPKPVDQPTPPPAPQKVAEAPAK